MGDVCEIPLYGDKAAGRVAVIDAADYELVSRYRWNVHEQDRGGRIWGPYAIANVTRNGKPATISMHRLVTGYARVDHRDGDGLNNRKGNLRDATASQNAASSHTPRKAHWSSRYRGVTWHAGKWQAQIRKDNRRIYLGRFATEEAAAVAYNEAARRLFGEFARLNGG